MNRNDWVFVGIRLYGLYLFVTALLDTCDVLRGLSGHGSGWTVVNLILVALVGLVLFLGAPRWIVWLQRRDGVQMESAPRPQP